MTRQHSLSQMYRRGYWKFFSVVSYFCSLFDTWCFYVISWIIPPIQVNTKKTICKGGIPNVSLDKKKVYSNEETPGRN